MESLGGKGISTVQVNRLSHTRKSKSFFSLFVAVFCVSFFQAQQRQIAAQNCDIWRTNVLDKFSASRVSIVATCYLAECCLWPQDHAHWPSFTTRKADPPGRRKHHRYKGLQVKEKVLQALVPSAQITISFEHIGQNSQNNYRYEIERSSQVFFSRFTSSGIDQIIELQTTTISVAKLFMSFQALCQNNCGKVGCLPLY